jgi:putative ABC transport system permease protein
VYTRGLGFAGMTVPHDLLLAHTTSHLDDAVFVRSDGDSAHVTAAVREELARLAPGASLRTAGAFQADADKSRAQNTWTNQVIAAVLLGYAVIASMNTLFMAGLARRREFAILRLAGTTRRQILRMVRLEQVLLLAIALVLGTAIAAATLVPAVRSLTGSATPYIPWTGWLAILGGTALLAAVAVAPVRRVLRTQPVEAIGVRE